MPRTHRVIVSIILTITTGIAVMSSGSSAFGQAQVAAGQSSSANETGASAGSF
jgi:hypothetical protein